MWVPHGQPLPKHHLTLTQLSISLISVHDAKKCKYLMHINNSFPFYFLLTPSTPAVPNCCCSKSSAPYWSDPPFLIFDTWALWRSVLSSRAPKCQKLNMVGQTSITKCKALNALALKELNNRKLLLTMHQILALKKQKQSIQNYTLLTNKKYNGLNPLKGRGVKRLHFAIQV